MQNEDKIETTFMNSLFWPSLVVVLLLGHVSLMMVLMTFAGANPPGLVEGSPYAGAPQAESSATP